MTDRILLSDLADLERARAGGGLAGVMDERGVKVHRDKLGRAWIDLSDAERFISDQEESVARSQSETTRLMTIEASLNRGEVPNDVEARKVFEATYDKQIRKGQPEELARFMAFGEVRHQVLGAPKEEGPTPTYTFGGFDRFGAVVSEVH